MAKLKSPAFSFYPGDWLSSLTIAEMSPEAEGAYIRLLCYAWGDPECSIPDDDAWLARTSRLFDRWDFASRLLRVCFVPHPTIPGRLYSPRLLRERKLQESRSAAGRLGGKTSGESRKQNASKQASKTQANHQANRQAKVNITSSSSSSSSSLYSSSSSTPSSEAVSACADTCSEAKQVRSEPVALSGHEFPVAGKSGEPIWTMPQALLDEFRASYPALDLDDEMRKARAWLVANAARRKTARGMPRFLNGWLERTQNASRAGPSLPFSEKTNRTVAAGREWVESMKQEGTDDGPTNGL